MRKFFYSEAFADFGSSMTGELVMPYGKYFAPYEQYLQFGLLEFPALNVLNLKPEGPMFMTSDYVREGKDTEATMSEGSSWITGTIDAEPIAGDGVTLDRQGGYIDKDWYKITLIGGRMYEFEGQNVSMTTGRIAMSLRDSNENVVEGIYGEESNFFASGETISFTFTSPTTQTFYIAVSASDTNGSDFRTATGNFEIRFDSTPDLVIEDVDIPGGESNLEPLEVLPESYVSGDSLTVEFDIGNIASGFADATYVAAYMLVNGVSTEVGRINVSEIDSNGRENDLRLTLVIPEGIELGTRIINLRIDPQNNIAETDDDNNDFAFGVNVVSGESEKVSISPDNPEIIEDEGATIIFTITRDSDLVEETFYYATYFDADTPQNDGDYEGIFSTAITFAPGETQRTVVVTILNDDDPEPNESFNLYVGRNSSDPRDNALDEATFTIIDDDVDDYADEPGDVDSQFGVGALTIGSAVQGVIGTPDANDGTFGDKDVFSVSLIAGHSYTFTVNGSNGLSDAIFSLRDSSFNIIGELSSQGDPATLTYTATETGDYFIRVGTGVEGQQGNYELSAIDNGVVESTIWFSDDNYSVNESEGTLTITLSRSQSIGNETVYVSTFLNGQQNNGDYTPFENLAVTFLDGSVSATFDIDIGNDSIPEPNQTFRLQVQRNASDLADTFLDDALFTIIDDDGPIVDTIREGITTTTVLSEGADWTTDIIDEEPIDGNGFTQDGQGGFVDKDWFEVTLSDNRSYIFEAESISITTGQVFIRLYDVNGNAVYSSTHDEGSSASFDFATGANGGTYYLAISASDDNAADFRTATGEYRVRFQDQGQLNVTDVVREGTDTTASLTIGNSASGVIDQFGIDGANPEIDKDWYAVDLIGGQNYTFMGQASDGSLGAVAIRIYDSSGVAVSTLGIGNSAKLNFSSEVSGTYYLAISAAGNDWQNASGAYSVSVVENHEPITNYYIDSETEVNEADGQFKFNITRTGDLPGQLIYVEVAPTNGSENDGDYTPFITRSFYFEPGEASTLNASLPFSVDILNDDIIENNEQFSIRVYSLDDNGNQLNLTSTTITIINDDAFDPSDISSANPDASEILDGYPPDSFFVFPIDTSTANSTSPLTLETGLLSLGSEQFQYFLNVISAATGVAESSFGETQLSRFRAVLNNKLGTEEFIQYVMSGEDLSQITIEGFVKNRAWINKLFGAIDFFAGKAGAAADIANILVEFYQTFKDPSNSSDLAAVSLNLFVTAGLTLVFPPLGVAYGVAQVIPIGDGLTIGDVLEDAYRETYEQLMSTFNDGGVSSISTFEYARGELQNSLSSNSYAFQGSDGDNSIVLSSSADTVYAGRGDDTIESGAGADFVFAEAGNDLIKAASGSGDDYYDGGEDIDTVSYQSSQFDLEISLENGAAQSRLETERWEVGTDTLVNIENVIGGLANDRIVGTFGANELDGYSGNDQLFGLEGIDTLLGGAGDDILNGGAGADVLDGGTGNDTASYSGSGAGVVIDLEASTARGGDAEGDTLSLIENVSGSDHNDVLRGDEFDNILTGGAGADILMGRGGADQLNGGDGFDSVDYRDSSSRIAFNVVNGGTVGDAAGDSFVSIERFYLSDFNDIVTGSDANEFFYGGDGNDQINGGGGIDRIYGGNGNDIQRGDAGNDTLYGSAGSDQLNGGTGFDIANYSNATSRISLNLGSGGVLGDAAGDTYFGIEAVYGSDFNDIIAGNSSGNELRGGEGDDILNGAAGNDRLFGEAGADALNGGTGTDIAVYTNASSGVTLSLMSGGTGGDAAGDSFSSVEWVWGSAFNDTLSGNSGNNRLEGRDGDDILNGEAGNDRLLGGNGHDTIYGGDGVDTIFGQDGDDVLYGGAGNDFFFGGAGADSHDGGEGTDTVSYLASTSGVTLNLQTGGTLGDAAGDSYTSIERVFGSQFDDVIRGSNTDDTLQGYGGDDYLEGGLGNDSLFGGAGNDSYGYNSINGGADVINGFDRLAETIFMLGGDPDFDSWAEISAVATNSGSNVVFNFGGGNQLTLIGYNLEDLDGSEFDFGGTPPAGELMDGAKGFDPVYEPLTADKVLDANLIDSVDDAFF